jgi:hypothetical protein
MRVSTYSLKSALSPVQITRSRKAGANRLDCRRSPQCQYSCTRFADMTTLEAACGRLRRRSRGSPARAKSRAGHSCGALRIDVAARVPATGGPCLCD